MSDVAVLGLAIDSRQAVTAATALDKLVTSAKSAGEAADKLAAATGKSQTQIRGIQSAADRAGVSFGTMNARVDASSTVHNKLAAASTTAAQGIANLANAAAGGGGMSTGYGSGSLVNAADKSSSALDRLANTLTRRVLFAAAAKEVRDFAAYVWQLNGAIAATADAAQRSNIGGGTFQGLQTSAANKGISNTDFNGAMVSFNQQVDRAKSGLGDLKALLSLNGKTVGDTATTFGVVADLVRNAATEAQKFSILQSAGLPANAQFVKYMEQGRDAITKQAAAARVLSDLQLAKAKEVDDAWQSGWTKFENNGKAAVVAVFGALSSIGGFLGKQASFMNGVTPGQLQSQSGANLLKSGQGTQLSTNDANSIYNAVGGHGTVKTPDPTADLNKAKELNAQLQARLSLQTQLGGVDAIVAAKEAELAGASLNLTGANKTLHDQIIIITRATAENTLVQNQAQVGVFNLDLANKAAADTLQMWKAKKLFDPASTQQLAAAQNVLAKQIQATSDAAQVAASKLPQMTQMGLDAGNMFKQLDTFGMSAMNGLDSALVGIATHSTSAGDGFRQFGLTVVTALEHMIVQMMIIKPLMSGLSGLFGGIFGGGGGALPGTAGSAMFGPVAPGFAGGGYTGSGGKYEPAGVVHRGEYVMDARTTSRIGVGNLDRLRGYAGGGSVGANDNSGSMSSGPSVSITNYNDFRGSDPSTEAKMKQYVDQSSKQAVQQAVQQVATIKGTSPSYLRASR